MDIKSLFFLLSIFFLINCSDPKPVIPLPDDGTSVYFDAAKKPFYHGVASGDPMNNQIIIWTRVTPESIGKVEVKWSISTDSKLANDAQSGMVTTDEARDYTVKVDVKDLKPNTTYYYQFEALGKKSIIGRTKTTATGTDNVVKLAFVSCSNFEAGYYNAFAKIAEKEDLDAVVHLGDYIYEYQPDRYGDKTLDRKHLPAKEITTLSDYRTRYAQYRLDKDFQKVHQMHPFITIWDDHEIANNAYNKGAQNHQDGEGDFMTRKEIAKQVYFEWLPVRDNTNKEIYRTIHFGEMVDLIMLDERLTGRTYPVDSINQKEFNESTRTMLGTTQLEWFKKELKNSKASWKMIGNQVIFSPLDIKELGYGSPINLDAWDGYPYERDQIRQFVEDNNIENVIITAGDTHSSWAFEIPAVDKKKSIAIEVGTPSITSANSNEGRPDDQVIQAEGVLRKKNPHLKFTNLRDHGYLLLTANKDKTIAQWYYVDRINAPGSQETLSKEFIIKNNALIAEN